jgi:hypothetical protein
MPLTPDAKKLLAETIRGTQQDPEKGVRARLIRAIHDEADRRYRLSVPISEAGLDESYRTRRQRIEGWLAKRVRTTRPASTAEAEAARERLLRQAEKEAAATFINRIFLVRQLEVLGLSKPAVVAGGWSSKGYREFREFAPGLSADEAEGYGTLLQLVFDELAQDLPGLFGDVGLTSLLPVPPGMLREVIERLDDPGLASAWSDDTALGWVYQFWNDPERREIDALLDAQSKLQSRDIAAKTQVFTERYMVEWLLQNSLGPVWRAICKKRGWLSALDRALPVLEQWRMAWRQKQRTGEHPADAPSPVDQEAWKYLAAQPIPNESVDAAPESIRGLKLLDPACGSGHFLVIAFGLLSSLYREEARHRGESWSDRDIAESILENNLFGIDIDPRAVQIAAASLYLKAKAFSKDARPKRINLVAPYLQLGKLPADDPAVAHLRHDLKRDAGIPEELTAKLISALAGVDHLGSLLRVDAAVEEAIRNVESEFTRTSGQGDLFTGFRSEKVTQSVGDARATVLTRLERFLAAHSSSEDLGLRLDGEQLTAGLRFLRLAQPETYDIVVGNPPYFGTQALADTNYIDSAYPQSKENLCTALFERATELVRPGGQVAFVTVRNWLYLSQLAAFRGTVFRRFPPSCAADLGLGGFEALPGVEATMVVVRRGSGADCTVVDAREGAASEKAAALTQAGNTFITDPSLLARLPGSPFVYRWSRAFIEDFLSRPLLGELAPVRVGMKTSDNLRFLRCPWELRASDAKSVIDPSGVKRWAPYVKGAAGKVWIEPLADVVDWRDAGLGVRIALDAAYGQGPQGEKHFFSNGVAFSTIGRSFIARAHRYPSIFDVAGSSVFPPDVAATACLLNSKFAREVVQDLNPTINFQVGDVARIPYRPDKRAGEIFRVLQEAFTQHEAGDELSPTFKGPAPSPWQHAQQWAQEVVDSPESDELPPYAPTCEPVAPLAFVSFALGIAFGRFGANGEGWIESTPGDSLPSGILFLSSRRSEYDAAESLNDGLDHPACGPLKEAWKEHAQALGDADDLRTFLRKSFFELHKKLYENRPIYFPLSSSKKSFVALVSIHRWADNTLQVLLADHLVPEQRRLEGELEDIKKARTEAAAGRRGRLERRLAELQKLLEELNDFITKASEIAAEGPPQPEADTPKREADAEHRMDLDDGVMINSCALWPLLEPQWKEPKKWWNQLASRSGPKGTHFDWSRTAARYFPERVRKACEEDPVLAVAHRCLWRNHPKVAYEWELCLQHEIRFDFAIGEGDADAFRKEFLESDPQGAAQIRVAETRRRERRPRGRSASDSGGADA